MNNPCVTGQHSAASKLHSWRVLKERRDTADPFASSEKALCVRIVEPFLDFLDRVRRDRNEFELDFILVHGNRSEEHTSELQSLMRISYAVFCLKKKKEMIQLQYKKSEQKFYIM